MRNGTFARSMNRRGTGEEQAKKRGRCTVDELSKTPPFFRISRSSLEVRFLPFSRASSELRFCRFRALRLRFMEKSLPRWWSTEGGGEGMENRSCFDYTTHRIPGQVCSGFEFNKNSTTIPKVELRYRTIAKQPVEKACDFKVFYTIGNDKKHTCLNS